jgi:hypothetical protein
LEKIWLRFAQLQRKVQWLAVASATELELRSLTLPEKFDAIQTSKNAESIFQNSRSMFESSFLLEVLKLSISKEHTKPSEELT